MANGEIPNATTQRTFAATDRGEGLTICADANDMFQKLKEYQELSREIIRESGDNLLVKVTGLYLEQYRTTAFERWTSRAAYDRRQKADGNQVFCHNLAETEETVLADWNKFITERQDLCATSGAR